MDYITDYIFKVTLTALVMCTQDNQPIMSTCVLVKIQKCDCYYLCLFLFTPFHLRTIYNKNSVDIKTVYDAKNFWNAILKTLQYPNFNIIVFVTLKVQLKTWNQNYIHKLCLFLRRLSNTLLEQVLPIMMIYGHSVTAPVLLANKSHHFGNNLLIKISWHWISGLPKRLFVCQI